MYYVIKDGRIIEEYANESTAKIVAEQIGATVSDKLTYSERRRLAVKHNEGRLPEGLYDDGYEDGAADGMREAEDSFKKLLSSGQASDGFHTFNELYDFRREYNAALVNYGPWPAHKSRRHHNGELCFGGGWFVVMIDTPFGQISNHYEDKYWDEFDCIEKETADKWDGHTEKDVLDRLRMCNTRPHCENCRWFKTNGPCDHAGPVGAPIEVCFEASESNK